MGGTNEATLAPPPGVKANNVRIHENAGEVHFHDDAAGLKVAVPVQDFKDRMTTLDDPNTAKVMFDDDTRGTRATVTRTRKGDDVTVAVEKTTIIGKTLKALKDFASKV